MKTKLLSGLIHLALDSPSDLNARISGGHVIGEILNPLSLFVDRQEETIELFSPNVNQRTIAIETRPDRLQSIAEAHEVTIDLAPIALIPKMLFHRFDFYADGNESAVITRRENARVALAHLLSVVHAQDPSLAMAIPLGLVEYLGQCVGKFPQNTGELTFDERLQRHIAALPDEPAAWLRHASSVPNWPRLLANYEESFLLIPREVSTTEEWSRTYRVEYLEPRVLGGPPDYQRDISNHRHNEGMTAAVRINQVGRARSHTIHFNAPSGTIIGKSVLMRLPVNEPLTFREAGSRYVWTYYLRRRALRQPRSVTLNVTLWPDPRGFVTPLRLLTLYTLVAELFLGASVWVNADVISSHAGVVTVVLFLPALLNPWLYNVAETPVKSVLISPWRRVAAACLGLLAACILLAILASRATGPASYIAPIGFLVCIVLTTAQALNTNIFCDELVEASDNVHATELDAPKGSVPFTSSDLESELMQPRAPRYRSRERLALDTPTLGERVLRVWRACWAEFVDALF